jgi:tripartite-type tricarboxylate transporter receptor subunit TctC
MELIKASSGADLVHVPYRGSSQALNDLVGGHVDLLATNLTATLGAIKAGGVMPIALTTAARSALVPEVPTLAETGFAGIDVASWYGLMAPRAIPDATRDAIFAVTRDVLTSPAIRELLDGQGLVVSIEEPSVFAARIRRETVLWADVIRKNNISAQ